MRVLLTVLAGLLLRSKITGEENKWRTDQLNASSHSGAGVSSGRSRQTDATDHSFFKVSFIILYVFLKYSKSSPGRATQLSSYPPVF